VSAKEADKLKIAMILLNQSEKPALSKAEEEKRRIRRERNKIAATKCRQKRRAHSVNVDSEYNKVLEESQRLEAQVTAARREKEELKRLLETHYPCKLNKGIKKEPVTPRFKTEIDPMS